ncbi:MAG: DUF1700 domain-containing protein [Clostridiales bacterium]|nr:DUF1700 domain-containing protein [Clostridiales bacterium]
MNRDEFMAQLARLLVEMPENERMEAIRYYNDYFDEAGEENEAKVIGELGSPERVAASIKANLQDGTFSENIEENKTAREASGKESKEMNGAGWGSGGQENSGQGWGYENRNQGEYTENGYRENRSYSSDWRGASAANMTVRKPRSAGAWALIVIVLIFASPVILGVGGGLLGGILGLLGGLIGLIFGALASGLGFTIGGAAIFMKGVVNVFRTPAMGLTGMGGGLLMASVGLLFLVLFLWFCFQILPRLFRAIVNFVSRILHRGKGDAVS